MIDDPPDATEINYAGSTEHAMHAGWERESSFAVESILKATIAAQREVIGRKEPPPIILDVGELWSLADLPKPDEEDRTRLLLVTEMLYWSARYAAPLPGKKADDRMNAIAGRARKRTLSNGQPFTALAPWTWDHLDRMYQVAHDAFVEAMDRRPGGRLWREHLEDQG